MGGILLYFFSVRKHGITQFNWCFMAACMIAFNNDIYVSLISVVRSDFSIALWEMYCPLDIVLLNALNSQLKFHYQQDLFLKESTYDSFRVSNSSITVFLDFNYSLLTLILNDSLHCLWLFECSALFNIDKQALVPTSLHRMAFY